MFPYESLEVYKKAKEINKEVYRFLKENNSIPAYLRNQLGRASLSIMLNIAEGSGKFSQKDRRNFFVTARGSAFECGALVSFLFEEKEIDQTFFQKLYNGFDEVSRILYRMIQNLEGKKKEEVISK